MKDFYDGISHDTAEILRKAQLYVDMAIKNGDAAYQDKVGEVTIKIRLPKKEKPM
jgi:hypothetical protein